MLKFEVFALGLVLLFVETTTLFAQSEGHGRVRGVITDAITGETLAGANVILQGNSSVGTATNLDGEYIINRVPVGTAILVGRYIGYANTEVEVTVERGETTTINFEMTPESVTGEEVIVSAQAQGQQQAINQQLSSDNIVNIVSETKIQELPDFNAASALGRLPGVSTTQSSGEDNKVVIRGLSPKYNSIEVEGIQLASTGSSSAGLSSNDDFGSGGVSNDRSVDLTMVSPYMIRMIEVYKSLTPDMNANSLGGTVNMELREAPSGLRWDAMWQQGYTAKSNTYGNYRAIASVSNRFFDDKLGVYALVNSESYDRNSDNLNANYSTVGSEEEIDPETGFRPVQVNSVTLNRHLETRNRVGGNLILDYDINNNGSLKFINMLAAINSDFTDHNQNMSYSNGRLDWRLSMGETQILQRVHSLKFDYNLGWVNVDLSASYTGARNTLEDSPVLTFFQNQGVDNSQGRRNLQPEDLIDRLNNYRGEDEVFFGSGNQFSNFYEEDRITYKGDFQFPYNVGTNINGFFKVGGQIVNQRNSTDQETPYVQFTGDATEEDDGIANSLARTLRNEFNLVPTDNGRISGATLLSGNDDLFNAFLDDEFGGILYASNPTSLVNIMDFVIGNQDFDASNEQRSTGSQGGWYDGPYQQLVNDYTYHEDYYATYAMSKINIGKLMVIGGARYEQVDSEYFAYNARDARNAQNQAMFDTTSSATNDHILPMIQARFSPFDWMDVRYAYTQTLSRPDYSLLSPKFTVTQNGQIYTGNPGLQPAKSHNHDISFSFYANKLGLFTVGAFQKTIENFVYDASYKINLGEEAGIDQLSNYQIICSDYIRQRYAGQPNVSGCQDGSKLVSPVTRDVGGEEVSNASVTRPVNNPNDALVRGIELDFQHQTWYLPSPLNTLVLGANYARIFSELETPFYYEDSRVEGEGRDAREVFFLADSSFIGRLSGQPNHVLNTYFGYDYKGFSARFSLLLQTNTFGGSGGTNPELDRFSLDYLKLDFSAKQKLPILNRNSEIFFDIINLNSANNQSVQRSINGFSNIQNYGLTANLGIRFRY